jgi:UDP-glucose 4-epimerase
LTSNLTIGGKTILITETGSSGILHWKDCSLTEMLLARPQIPSRDEAKQDLMRHEVADPRLRFYLGDIRDHLSVERSMAEWTSAFLTPPLSNKCPSGEFFPMEISHTLNQFMAAAKNLVRAAEAAGAASLVRCL